MDGILFASAGLYYNDGLRPLAHSMKANDREGIRKAAMMIAPLIPQGSCLIPAPGRNGYADHTLVLAEELVRLTGAECRDVLKGRSRISHYQAKINGRGLTEKELGFYAISPIPQGLKPIVLDNVIGTGLTGKAAVRALGKGTVLALAMDDNFYHNANSRLHTIPSPQVMEVTHGQELKNESHNPKRIL